MTTPFSPAQQQQFLSALQAARLALHTERRATWAATAAWSTPARCCCRTATTRPSVTPTARWTSPATDRETLTLAQIDAALQRLAEGQYGLCTDCGDTIPAARLTLSPHAARCVACESVLERGQPRPATM